MEVNTRSGAYFCFKCHAGGFMPDGWQTDVSMQSFRLPKAEAEARAVNGKTVLTDSFPHYVRQEIERRGQEIPWIVHRYGVRWDGERLRWPAGDGASRRACLPWEAPKTLSVAPRGLIGQHLISGADRRSDGSLCGLRVVLTEGDWKAASIPLPWIGLGLLGTSISNEQAVTLRCANPAVVLIALDRGYELAAEVIVTKLLPTPCKVVKIPYGKGPDDLLRCDLVKLLLSSDK